MPRLILSIIALLFVPVAAFAETVSGKFAVQTDLDHVWTITAATLVFFMQGGFLLLEAGQVRSKNSVNVAQKNLMDFILSVMVFGALGYMLMFGASAGGWVGWQPDLMFFGSAGDWSLTFFLFQLMFCGTAATIVSGAVAERMAINGYLLCTLLIAAVIYPVAGHWAWGGLLNGSDEPLLARMGFMDFAGSTVVHSVGAWVGLAAIIVIGPRIGKFDKDGTPRVLHGHSPVLSTAGAIVLWVGWIGFNGGSMLAGTSAFAQVVVNTVIAGGAGGLALMCIGRFTAGCFRPDASINGVLGGLVAITASADVMTSQTAFFIGLLAGLVVHAVTWLLESVAKLDDPLGAIAVHGGAGAFGTIIVAFFAPADALLAGTRMEQFFVQVQGVGLVLVWSFGVSFAALKGINALMIAFDPNGGGGLRVPREHEIEGLNQHEHDAPMGTGILQNVMAEVAVNPKSGLQKLDLDYGDEAYETSVLFNKIIDNIGAERDAEEQNYQGQKAARMAVEDEIREVVEACVMGDYSKRLDTKGKAGFLLELCRGINNLSETTESSFHQIGKSLEAISAGDLSKRMSGDFSGTLGEIQTALNDTLDKTARIMDEINRSVSAASQGDFTQRLDVTDKDGFFLRLCEEINMLCDISDRGLSDLFETLQDIGDGNLNASMSTSYQGSFAKIGVTVRQMADGIAELMLAVLQTGEAVSEGSQNISKQTDNVKLRSQEQVASMEQSQELLSELVKAITEMADDSVQADKLCLLASEQAELGRSLADRTTQQILTVAQASEAIAKAVERIETIARQSTMLSFNASVEAARSSGDGGKSSSEGFKVVAQEVRNMSMETADAAEEIRTTTEKVREAVGDSVKLVEETVSSLNEINTAMNDSTARVTNLRKLGEKQSSHATEVHRVASQVLERATQTLSFVDGASENSKTLNEEAQRMIASLSRFKGIDGRDDLAA